MQDDDLSQVTPSGQLIRYMVGGLPLGLIILGALSFVIWSKKKEEKAPIVSVFASMLQKDVNRPDFERFVRILHEEIGQSQLSDEDKLEACRVFIDSSMSADNMGYEVKRRKYPNDEWMIFTELPGKHRRSSPLVLWVDGSKMFQDAQQSAPVAALMSIANALTGREHARTLRFAVISGEYAHQKMLEDSDASIRISAESVPPGEREQVFNMSGNTDILLALQSLQRAVETGIQR